MEPTTPDEEYASWITNDLLSLYRMRMKALLRLEVEKGPLMLLYKQERLVMQMRRLLRQRGVENPSMS